MTEDAQLPLFDLLSDEVAGLVRRLLQPRSYEFGDVIVAEGSEADGFYIMVSGTARVITGASSSEVGLARLFPGDSFGEASLLDGSPRSATVRASGPVSVLWMEQSVFHALADLHPELKVALSTQAQARAIHRSFRRRSAFAELPLEAVLALMPRFETVELAPDEILMKAGEPGDALYLVHDGRLRATVEADGERRIVGYIRDGDLIGERALATGEPRVATVAAVTAVTLSKLTLDDFQAVAAQFPQLQQGIAEIAAGRNYRDVARIPFDFAEEIPPGQSRITELTGDDPVTPPTPPLPTSRRHRAKFPFIQQLNEMDCGVACLAMVSKAHGHDISLGYLRDLAGTGAHGTSLRGLTVAAREAGFDAEPVKLSRERLAAIALPTIIHWEGNHWVVVHGVSAHTVDIADPGVGLVRVSREECNEKWDGYCLRLVPTPKLNDAPTGSIGLGWLRPFLHSHRRALTIAALLSLLSAGFEVVLPLVVEHIVNSVVQHKGTAIINELGVSMVILIAAGVGVGLGQRQLINSTSRHFDDETLNFLTGRLLRLPMSYFANRRIGDIERRIGSMQAIRRLIVDEGTAALSALAQLLVGLVVMFTLSWQLSVVFIALMPLYALMVRYSNTRLRPIYSALEQSFGTYASDQMDLLKGIESVKASGTESALQLKMRKSFRDLSAKSGSHLRTISYYNAFVQGATLITYGLFIYLGALAVHGGSLKFGAFVAFTSLVLLNNAPLLSLLSMVQDVQVSSVLLNRIAEVLEHEPEQHNLEELTRMPSIEGHVRLENLSYQPITADLPILSDINLEVEPGTTVAIVGRSGSGKTTLLRLLAGLIAPTSGTITYDRVPMERFRFDDLRRHIGVVLQQAYLFSATISENIALGEAEPNLDQVRWAAETADIAELVAQLPLGYETVIGDHGLPLSGGQAQRVAIARAIYHEPAILLFDEATSALDAESESVVKHNIDRLLAGRTAFVVAHRLSTIRNADIIVVLDRGQIVEKGTHDELLARRGVYFYLHSQQGQPEGIN